MNEACSKRFWSFALITATKEVMFLVAVACVCVCVSPLQGAEWGHVNIPLNLSYPPKFSRLT